MYKLDLGDIIFAVLGGILTGILIIIWWYHAKWTVKTQRKPR